MTQFEQIATLSPVECPITTVVPIPLGFAIQSTTLSEATNSKAERNIYLPYSVLLTQYCAGDKIEKNEMGWACGAYG